MVPDCMYCHWLLLSEVFQLNLWVGCTRLRWLHQIALMLCLGCTNRFANLLQPQTQVFLVSLSRAIALALYSRYSELPHIWLSCKLLGDLPNNLIQRFLKHLFWDAT